MSGFKASDLLKKVERTLSNLNLPAQTTPPPVAVSAPSTDRPAKAGQTILTLNAEERDALLWAPGDRLVVYSGSYQCTKVTAWKPPESWRPELSYLHFIFDMPIGDLDLTLCGGNVIPNGPALLIANERENSLCAWALISMINRAWTYSWPPEENMHYRRTKKMAAMLEQSVGGGVMGLAFRKKIQDFVTGRGTDAYLHLTRTPELDQMESLAKRLTARIASQADSFWNAGGNSTGGKL